MRPVGEIRTALMGALAQGPGFAPDLATRACVGRSAAQATLDNMARAGAVAAALVPRAGSNRPCRLYDLPERAAARRQPAGVPGIQFLDAPWR